jgi:branched-chain amino acid transport system permease protein
MRRLVGRSSVLGLAWVVLALVPIVANPYLVYVASIALLYVILAVGLNILLGYAGQFAFANAALFGIGAYATGLAQLKLGLPFWIALPTGAVFTTLAGLLVALPALRLSGLYLALATMAFAQFTQWVMLNWETVTLGAGGFKLPPPSFGFLGLSSSTGVYYLTLAVTTALVIAAWNTVRSWVGRAMIAVRDSEVAAETLGVDLARTKTLAFAISAFYAGTAGGLYSATLNFVAPEGFDLFQMVVHFSMVVVGVLGSVWGAVLGAALLVGVQEALRAFKGAQEIAFGLVLMLAIIFLPEGLISLLRRRVPGWEEPLRRVAPAAAGSATLDEREPARARVPHAGVAHPLLHAERRHRADAVAADEPLRHLEHVFLAGARAEDHGEQLDVREPARPALDHLLAGPHAPRKIAHPQLRRYRLFVVHPSSLTPPWLKTPVAGTRSRGLPYSLTITRRPSTFSFPSKNRRTAFG